MGRTTSPVPMMWTLRSGRRQLKDETSVGMNGCWDLLQRARETDERISADSFALPACGSTGPDGDERSSDSL